MSDGSNPPDGGAPGPPNLVFSRPVIASKAIIHDNDTFQVQWASFNAGATTSPGFTDLLVVESIPEGCPGSDDNDHPVKFSSDTDADDPNDFLESALDPGQEGSLMMPMVGPFPAGSYRLTVTLAQGLSNTVNFTCIDIIPADS